MGVDWDLYTTDSWAPLWAAAAAGKALIDQVNSELVALEFHTGEIFYYYNTPAEGMQELVDAAEQAIYDAFAGLVTKADFINGLTNAQIQAGLKLNGKVITLDVGGDIYTLSTNANNLNQSGTVKTNGVTITFDIKGNGSNIKLFAIN